MAMTKGNRIVTLLCLIDGHMADFEDDGLDSVGKPKVRRLNILAALKKTFKKGKGPIYCAGRRVVVTGKDGKETVRFEPATITPFSENDDLPDLVPVLDEAKLRILKESMAEREQLEKLRAPKVQADASVFMQQFFEQMKSMMMQAFQFAGAAKAAEDGKAPRPPGGPAGDGPKGKPDGG